LFYSESNIDLEGKMALRQACGDNENIRDIEKERRSNLLRYASIFREKYKKKISDPDTLSDQDIAVIGLNRIEGYSLGYEKGAKDAFTLILGFDKNLAAKVCGYVKSERN
jgi:hypothetical protein